MAQESRFLAYGVTIALALLATLWLGATLLLRNDIFISDNAAHATSASGKMSIRTITLLSNSNDAATTSATPNQPITTSNPTLPPTPATEQPNAISQPTEAAPALSTTITTPATEKSQNNANTIGSSGSGNAENSGSGTIDSKGSGNGTGGDNAIQATACDVRPTFIYAKKPLYPEQARRNGISGQVYVSVLLSESGRPIKAMVVKRQPVDCTLFDGVALKAALESRYSPGMQQGKAVKVWLTIPMRFELK